jgi:hypothetical protein
MSAIRNNIKKMIEMTWQLNRCNRLTVKRLSGKCCWLIAALSQALSANAARIRQMGALKVPVTRQRMKA